MARDEPHRGHCRTMSYQRIGGLAPDAKIASKQAQGDGALVDGSALTARPLNDLEVALLEMVDFGIERWGSASAHALADSLVARGFIARLEEGTEPGVIHFAVTALGRQALFRAKK